MGLLSSRSVLAAVLALSSGAISCAHGTHPARPSTATIAPKPSAPAVLGGAIDAQLREEWKRAGIVPAPPADDATFLRRVYVDITGTIPPAELTTKFLASHAPDKRHRLVDELLASREYAEHWTNYWDDVLMGDKTANNLTDRTAFREWLHAQLADNAAWDRIVTELVSGTGQNGLGGRKVRGPSMQLGAGTDIATEIEPDLDPKSVNGAVNWTLRFEQSRQDLGGTAARVFLGVQIQCAQCHDHKTERWKQQDFRRFSSAFFRAKVEPIDKRPPNGQVKRVVLVDSPVAPPRFTKKSDVASVATAKATALDGTDLEKGKDTRKALAAWITSKKNPWFAKALVNRMWGHFLGRGFYDPLDDIRPSNPAAAPEVLDRIAADFAAHDFDTKHLIRTICATEAYQLAATRRADENETIDPENKLWGRFHLVPLGPEEMLNALFRATDLEKTAEAVGIEDVDALRANVVKRYAFLFDTDEDDDEPDYSGTVSHALALLNGALVRHGGRALPGSMLLGIVDGPGTTSEKIDRLTISVLARHPTNEERETWSRYVDDADEDRVPSARGARARRRLDGRSSSNTRGGPTSRGRNAGPLDRLSNRTAGGASPKQAAYEDLLWTMLNSSEFTFNH